VAQITSDQVFDGSNPPAVKPPGTVDLVGAVVIYHSKRAMSRAPKPLEIFTKPPHPRYNWTKFNEQKHELALNRAIERSQKAAEGRSVPGMTSLRRIRSRPGAPRFARLLESQRPQAEAELRRLVNAHIERTGHFPSRQKFASLVANATWIMLYCKTGKRKAWVNRAMVLRRVLDSHDRKRARAGTPAETPLKPKARSGWCGLPGI
jgi:hypothetical protein